VKRIPSLDGFRAISIILVLIAHGRLSKGFLSNYGAIAKHGAVGVTIFFVLSGFLITTLLLNEQAKNGHIAIKKFYLRRAFRILPVMVLYVVFIAIWRYIENIDVKNSEILHSLTFTMNFYQGKNFWYLGHYWTLSVEEQFYMIWPSIIIIFRHHIKTIAFVSILYSCIVRVLSYKFPAYQFILLSPYFNYSDAIMVGALGGILYFENPDIIDLNFFRSYFLQLLAIGVIGLFLWLSNNGKLPIITLPFGNFMISSLLMFLIFSYIKPSGSLVYTILNSKVMVHLGILSYSIYVWQQFFVFGVFNTIWRVFPYSLIAIYVVSAISYYLWERPFLNFKKHFSVNNNPYQA
jgi:peptidoglycan/LPS O-acetylase OafA/YrhL